MKISFHHVENKFTTVRKAIGWGRSIRSSEKKRQPSALRVDDCRRGKGESRGAEPHTKGRLSLNYGEFGKLEQEVFATGEVELDRGFGVVTAALNLRDAPSAETLVVNASADGEPSGVHASTDCGRGCLDSPQRLGERCRTRRLLSPRGSRSLETRGTKGWLRTGRFGRGVSSEESFAQRGSNATDESVGRGGAPLF